MAAKVEQTSLERRRNQSTASPAAAPATTVNSPKISMRSVKAGVSFVIPKNKLSGALVPVVRGVAKVEKNDSKRDDEVKQPQRKTKWGIDLTQDAAVRRGRALAYQTRAEQIAAQLESGNLENDPDGASRSPSPAPIFDESGQRINTSEARKREQLDLERREAIGECMRLNPNYKPPAGYMPVCKEAKMYIPVKETLGQNIVGLILGPQGNTRKRLEEETGTHIAIKGRVRDTKEEKMENADLDGKGVESINEELHVHISADSYEKIDAAIALLELLMTPVDGNVPPAGTDTASLFADGSKAPDKGAQVADPSHSMMNTNLAPNYAHPMHMPPPGQQPPHLAWSSSAMEAPGNVAWPSSAYATQGTGHHLQSHPHPGHWHSMGANNSAMQSHSGVVGPPNTAAYGMNNANMFIPRIPQQAFHPFPPFRGRPAAQGFNMHAVPANVRVSMPGPVNRPRPAFQVQHRPYVEMASQNQSTIMNSTSALFGARPPLVIGGSSNSSQAVHHTVPNAAPLPPSSNIMVGGGYGPPLPHGREPASAPLATAVQSHVPVSQPSNGPQQQQLQHSHTTTLASHGGSLMQVSPQVPAAMTPSPGSLLAQPQGAHSASSPAVTSHGLLPAAPQGPPPAISSTSVSHVLPSPRFPQPAPQRPHGTVPPRVVSPIPLSPGLPSPAPRAVHAAFPPPPTQVSQRPGFSQAPPQSAAVAVPPLIPSPPVPPTGNSFHTQPPRMAFMSQGSSVGLSSVALPVISATPTPASTILSGPMQSTVTNPSGITVATVQSGVASRPGLPPPVPSGTNISSQGSSVSSSVAHNSWQPQHLNSGDFTFQPLRSQAPSLPPAVRPLPSQPPLSDMHSQNPVPMTRPGYPPAGPNLPHSRPGQMRVSVPLPPTSATTTPLSSPPLPPLPPQAPSFRPAISLPLPPLSNSLQSTFSIPLGVSVSQTATVSPSRPNFLGSSQQMPPRPSGVSTSAAIHPFGLSAPHTIHPLPPQPRPQSGPESFHSFPSVPNFQCQEATSSQSFSNLSASNVSIPPPGPPPSGPPPPSHPPPSHPPRGLPPFPPPPRASPVSLPGNIPNQVGGSSFQQQQSSPALFPNISAVQASNVKHNHVTTSPQVHIPSHSQVRSIGPGQMYDLGYGGGVSKTLPASTMEGGGSQSYDPFSPTSIPPEQLHPQNDQPSNLPSNAGKAQDREETDAEYENLMESVGVR